MTGPVAQFVAMTCHANAFLRGYELPQFFPGNSTCQFCDWVRFTEPSHSFLGKLRESLVLPNPNQWFEHLKRKGVMGVRLHRTPQNRPGISDRMSAGFVAGAG